MQVCRLSGECPLVVFLIVPENRRSVGASLYAYLIPTFLSFSFSLLSAAVGFFLTWRPTLHHPVEQVRDLGLAPAPGDQAHRGALNGQDQGEVIDGDHGGPDLALLALAWTEGRKKERK